MPADSSTKKTVLVALGVCLISSIFVSSAAVGLSAIQEQNKKIDMITNILQAGDIEYTNQNPEQVFNNKVDPVVIELASGETLEVATLPEQLKPENFDLKAVSKNTEFTKQIESKNDIAGIKTRPTKMVVYEVLDENDQILKYILPIYGKGLWSTMYGFIALDKDLMTIQGITFFEHGETPGLGGEIDNPNWKKSWKGKIAFNEAGELKLKVIKGQVDRSSESAKYQIDGLSGATITTRGVDHTITYWMGEDGYGPFLDKLRGGNKS